MFSSIAKRLPEFFVVGILFVGVLYAVTTSWKNDERLQVIGSDIKSIKKSMISLLLDKKPNKSSIAKDLVSDVKFLNGVEHYKAGNYEKAYANWKESALQGNRDAVYAIAIVNDSLKEQLHNASLSNTERKTIEAVLRKAPDVKEVHGIYYLVKPRHDITHDKMIFIPPQD